MREVRLLDAAFEPAEAIGRFITAHPDAGAHASFTGTVRPDGDVEALELSHYEPLTLPGMEVLADTAIERFGLAGMLIVHRVGSLRPGEPIVCVAAAARHRRAAFEAVDFVMDHLKSAAWLWKRERRGGGWHWIEPRGEDHADLARWK